jgi:hypothetical protein
LAAAGLLPQGFCSPLVATERTQAAPTGA